MPNAGEYSAAIDAGGTVRLHYDVDQPVDTDALQGVLSRRRSEVWSHATVHNNEPFDRIPFRTRGGRKSGPYRRCLSAGLWPEGHRRPNRSETATPTRTNYSRAYSHPDCAWLVAAGTAANPCAATLTPYEGATRQDSRTCLLWRDWR